jgi:uncharacterized protein CbrC (UPF0167 family)
MKRNIKLVENKRKGKNDMSMRKMYMRNEESANGDMHVIHCRVFIYIIWEQGRWLVVPKSVTKGLGFVGFSTIGCFN